MSTEAEDAPVAREALSEALKFREWAMRCLTSGLSELVARGEEAPEAAYNEVRQAVRWIDAMCRAQINEQVGGGDLASLAERLDDVSGWQEGILARLGKLEEQVNDDDARNLHHHRIFRDRLSALQLRIEEVELWVGMTEAAPEPPQTPAERRTGEKLFNPVTGTPVPAPAERTDVDDVLGHLDREARDLRAGWTLGADDHTTHEEMASLAGARDASERRAREMPTTEDALRALTQAHHRLKELGWRDAAYGPQEDGATVEVIEAGSSSVHVARTHMLRGTFPRLTYWIDEAGDSWPSSPILFRAPQPREELRPPTGEGR